MTRGHGQTIAGSCGMRCVEDVHRLAQTEWRGIRNVADVLAIAREMSAIYEHVVFPWLPRNRAARIYEAGCGPGVLLHALREGGWRHTEGTDLSESSLTLARQQGFSVRCCDSVADLRSMAGESLDVVVGVDFIEHLPRESMVEFLVASAKVLKPGGALILRMPNADSPFVGRNLFNDITHQWAYTSVAFRPMLASLGFVRVVFADEATAAVRRARWIKVPLMLLIRSVARGFIRALTREQVEHFSPSVFVAAWKADSCRSRPNDGGHGGPLSNCAT